MPRPLRLSLFLILCIWTNPAFPNHVPALPDGDAGPRKQEINAATTGGDQAGAPGTPTDRDRTDTRRASEKQPGEWSIESPPGPQFEQPIDVTEGTWISVDVDPTGNEIVFDLLGDLYVMPITGADGSAGKNNFPEKLTSGIAWDMQPRFSHDGEWIAFTSDRTGKGGKAGDNIWIINRETKELRQITDEPFRLLNGPNWSPDDEYIVARKHFTSRRSLGAGEIWMYHRNAAGLNAMSGVQLTKRPNDQKDVNEPVFSPDGRYLYYSQDTTPGDTFQYNKDSNGEIYTIKRLDLETGETVPYITGPGGACRPVPSPDGKQIAFVRRVGVHTGLHIFDTESGAVRLIDDRLERDMQEAWAIHGVYPSFAWMPDGRSIVIWAKGKIRRIDVADGTDSVIPFRIKDTRTITRRLRYPVDVASDEFDVKMLRWVRVSPDGKQVAFQALGRIYVRELPHGEPRHLTDRNDEFEFCPSWSRDGKQIVYTTWNDRSLGAIRIASLEDSSKNRRITVRPGHYTSPVLSPDGHTVVFEKTGGGRLRSPLYSHEPGVYRIAVDGGQPVRIAKNGSNPQFAADSDRVFLQRKNVEKDADNRTLFSVKLSGQKDSDEREHFTSEWATDFRISPDGRFIAFIERFNVYLAPFVKTGSPINIGPGFKGLPVTRLNVQAGDWIHFSGDGRSLHWSLGPELFTTEIAAAMKAAKDDNEGPDPESSSIGFKAEHAKPDDSFALVGGRIITMGPQGVIEDGVVIVGANRIAAVGSRETVDIPEGMRVIDVDGQTVLPGFIDTHAHGAQATSGITPQENWMDYARLAFGVTTIHDPSNDTQAIFAASELAKAGKIIAPRTFSTGKILYGAAGSFKAEIDSFEDALFHLRRMKAVGAFSVKSYNQPRRDQRQQVVAAARQLKMMVVPEGGSTFMHNMTMIVDGHTGIEHTLPVQTAYDDVMDLWRNTEVGYTPTLNVAYGGIAGERYWYQHDDLWKHDRLRTFIAPHLLNPRSRRRQMAPREDYNHIRVAEIAHQVVAQGGLVQAGGHGQLSGLCTHWEMWSFVQGGMTPMQALRCGTLYGARYLGLNADLGSIEAGKLADLIVLEPGADPTGNIRDSERIQLTIANGRVFESATMTKLDAADSPTFFWKHTGTGISYRIPPATGCSCGRSAN